MDISYTLNRNEAQSRSATIAGPLNYEVLIRMNPDTFSGHSTISFITRSASKDIWIDYAGDTIVRAYLNTRILPTHRTGNKLFLGNLPAGSHKLIIEFTSKYSSNGTGLHKFIDPYDEKLYIYSYMCPYYANKVFPCFDQPDLKGTFVFHIESVQSHTALSNESVLEITKLDDDYLRHTFNATPVISTYVLAVICGEFQGGDEVYARSSLEPYIHKSLILEWLKVGKEQYAEYFGLEMPFSKCTQVFCPEFNMGAMENAGCVTINDSHVWKENPVKSEINWLQNIVLHELCHMWFGNYVTLQWWDNLWLNESFATYFSYNISQKALNSDAWVDFFLNKLKAYNMDSLSTTHPVHVEVFDTQEAISNLDSITYWKGASLLKNLSFIIGEKAFSEGLKRYFSAYSWGNVELRDFVDSMQTPSLKEWVSEWVETKGLNCLELNLKFAEDKIVSATVQQGIVTGEIYRSHHLLVEGFNEGGSAIKNRVVISAAQNSELAEFIGQEGIKGVLLNSDDHGYVQVILDEASLSFFFEERKIVELETLNRGLAWQSLWNRVESLKMKSSEFIKHVANLLQYEDDETIIDVISNYSNTILSEYCPYSELSHYSHELFEAIMNKLLTTPNNKCLQRKIFSIANTDEDILRAYEYSLTLNRSEKWKGIMLYASTLPIEQVRSILKEELKYDRNDMAVFLTNFCEAAAIDNKQESWDMIINKGRFSMLQAEYLMKGFWYTKNLKYYEGFFEKYFEILPNIVENYDREYAENFIRIMMPRCEDNEKMINKLKQVSIQQTWVSRLIRDAIESTEKSLKNQLNFS